MSKKHTPGPYTMQPPGLNGGNWCILAPEKETGWSSVLATLTPRADLPVEANARLFAAAPELLSVVRIVQQITTLDVNDLVGRIQIVALQGTLAVLCKMALEKVEKKEEVS